MKSIIIKEDGLAYVADLPEEPEEQMPICMGTVHSEDTVKEWEDYTDDLQSAKKSAILCENQEEAKEIIANNIFIYGSPTDGIYPIPGLEWTEEYQLCYNETAYERAVAILSKIKL